MKTVMVLHLPEPKVRKKTARAVQCHADKTKYTRKTKHKGSWDSPTSLSHFARPQIARSKDVKHAPLRLTACSGKRCVPKAI